MGKWLPALLLLSGFGISAQSVASDTLKEVVVSRLHVSDSLMDTPAAVSTIGKADLTANNATEIGTAMNRLSGVQMQSGSFNTNRISIRGIGARTPYGTNKMRAFYGNIPLTSGDSETTIEDIDVENLAGVEVIKGPMSSVYGSGLGGAILLQPIASSSPGNSFRVSAMGGSFGTRKTTLSYGLDKPSGSLHVSWHKLESDGWRENSAYRRDGVTLAGELFRRGESKLTYFGNFTTLKAFIPSSVNRQTLDENPKASAPTWKAAKGYEAYNSFLAGLAYEVNIGKVHNTTSVFYSNKNSNEPRPFDILLQNTNALGGRTLFRGKIWRFDWIGGAEYFSDHLASRNLENLYQENDGNGSLRGEKLAETTQRRQSLNVYAQLKIRLIEKLELQAGLNLNQTQLEVNSEFPETAPDGDRHYDPVWAPNLSLLYRPTSHTTFYTSASRGFSMPAIEETLRPDGSLNTGILPETGYNFEAGSKTWLFGRKLYAEIALYHMEIRNLLVAQRVGDDQYVGVNAGKSVHRGIEFSLEGRWKLNRNIFLQPFANGSFGEYRFREFIDRDIDRSGNRLPGVPSFKTNVGTRLDVSGFYVSAEFQYVDKLMLNDANAGYNPAFRVWNGKIGYNWKVSDSCSLEFYSGINNFTDERYAGMILPNAVAPPNGSARSFYPANPINYFGGFRVRGGF